MAKQKAKKAGNGANLGFEATLWAAADKLRNNMDTAEYKHVVLGLIFLKYISDAFTELHEKLVAGEPEESIDGLRRTVVSQLMCEPLELRNTAEGMT